MNIANIRYFIPYIFAVISFLIATKSFVKNLMILVAIKKAASMPYTCASLGYVINLSGKKGVGKTTTAAGICNYLIIYIQQKMMEEMENIRIMLSKIDFNLIENDYLENLKKFEFDHNLAVKQTIQSLTINNFASDYLAIKDPFKLLSDYLKRFYILNFRKNYVLSKTYFFDCINFENAILLDSASLELSNVAKNNNYQLDLGMVIFDDEKSLDSGNNLSLNKDVKCSGRKIQRALLRNAYEGLCFEVTTKQYDKDEVAIERKQIDANLNIRRRKELDSNMFIVHALKIIYWFCILPVKIFYLFNTEKIISFKNSPGFYRNFEKMIYDLENVIRSEGYIKVYCRNYFDPDDVGKQGKQYYDNTFLIFEKELCYGSCDTYEWRSIASYYDDYRSFAVLDSTSCLDDVEKIKIWNKSLKRGE